MIERRVDRIRARVPLGADGQVDDKAFVIAPDDLAATDPFLALSEDWFSTRGFDWHPHRGLETVTLVVDGVLEHGDSLGNTGALEAGDVQWMTAGRGIIHRELAYRDEHAHTLQLWLNLPADRRLVDTRYQDLHARDQAVLTAPGVRVRVVSGSVGGVTGPAANHWPILGLLLTVDPDTGHALPLPADHRAFAYVLTGGVTIAGRPVVAGETAWSDPTGPGPGGTTLALRTPPGDEQTTIMVYAGRPIGEPVVLGGSFVMNTHEEIARAVADFRAGRFGPVPRQARLLTR
jgi:redox-sensitive bicupin YhaK (pirin superfamily)